VLVSSFTAQSFLSILLYITVHFELSLALVNGNIHFSIGAWTSVALLPFTTLSFPYIHFPIGYPLPDSSTLNMHSLFFLTALFTAEVFSSPTPTQSKEKRSFVHTVQRKVTPNHPAAGSNAMAKAYNKYGFAMPSSLASAGANKAATGGQSGQVSAQPEQNDAEYLSPVKIGGQTLNMDFDTGSSDLWVFSTALNKQSTTGHTLFDPTKSTTFKQLNGATWQISYGDGSGAAGTVGTDQVNIGGATATSQAVELATAVSQSFVQDTNNDGLVGLAFSTLNTVKPTKQTTFFDTIMPQLAAPIFSVDLTNNTSGTYTFGSMNTARFTGSLTTVPVDSSSGFWQVTSNSFQVGTQNIVNQGGSPAIAGKFY
jgi:aspartyl protease